MSLCKETCACLKTEHTIHMCKMSLFSQISIFLVYAEMIAVSCSGPQTTIFRCCVNSLLIFPTWQPCTRSLVYTNCMCIKLNMKIHHDWPVDFGDHICCFKSDLYSFNQTFYSFTMNFTWLCVMLIFKSQTFFGLFTYLFVSKMPSEMKPNEI